MIWKRDLGERFRFGSSDFSIDPEAAVASDPKGPTRGYDNVLRGGSWDNTDRYCRSANREKDSGGDTFGPGVRLGNLGFRLGRSH